ncbi:MAG: RluA family pseudouridine synthase [Patescibacteria group bacterium]|nr:RluA family pseudouridine synthase [Patescibacteria group bacterium]
MKQEQPVVVYEDKNILAINKPAGLLVHHNNNSKSAGEETLADWLLKKYPEVKGVGDSSERPGIVHRLDKETSGLMLVAKNQKTFDYLKNLFQSRQIKKTYLAWVSGEPKEKKGVIDKPIGLKAGTVKHTVYGGKMIKPATTYYRVIKTEETPEGKISLLEVTPKTGRTHQIRVHLKSIGNPVLGDKLYGSKNTNFNRLMLHSYSLKFKNPEGKLLKIEVDPVRSFRKAFN